MKGGAETELQALMESHKGIIYKIARSYTTTPDDRQDLFQDIMLNIWHSHPSFRGDSKLTTWMYRVALYTAITFQRREKKWKANLVRTPVEDIPATNTPDKGLDEITLLYNAIEKLGSIDKAIILLILEEKSYNEIGDIMKLKPATVGMRVMRSKFKLVTLLSDLTKSQYGNG